MSSYFIVPPNSTGSKIGTVRHEEVDSNGNTIIVEREGVVMVDREGNPIQVVTKEEFSEKMDELIEAVRAIPPEEEKPRQLTLLHGR